MIIGNVTGWSGLLPEFQVLQTVCYMKPKKTTRSVTRVVSSWCTGQVTKKAHFYVSCQFRLFTIFKGN